MADKYGDVRPEYDSGATGPKKAEGVFIAGGDGTPIDLSKQPALPQLTNRSATLEAGVPVELMPANPQRRYGLVHNKTTGDLWIDEFNEAAVDGISAVMIPAGQQGKVIGNGALSALSVDGGNVYAVEG